MNRPFKLAFQDSFPVLLAYLPLGAAFGFLFEQTDYPWFFAPLFSLFVYAGAVQFMALSLITVQGSLFDLAITSLMLCVRNIFYGISFVERFTGISRVKKFYFIFSMVDSNFLILSHRQLEPHDKDMDYCFWLNVLTHTYWVGGTLLGGVLGNLAENIEGVEFFLIALFTVLTLEQFKKSKKKRPFIVAIFAATVSLLIYPQQFLLLAVLISLLSLAILDCREANNHG